MSKKSKSQKPHKLPNSRFTRFLAVVLRPFYHRKITGKENITPSKAAVFTCNHGQTSGPVSAVLHLPVRFRPWINACMLDPEEAMDTMMRTFRDKFKFLGDKTKHRIRRFISGIICHILNSYEPIPVYKGKPKESVGTIEQSVAALECGDNLLIFPEKPTDRYDENSYKQFNTGFAAIGRAWYEHSGECLEFYPIWTSAKSHCFRIGKPVTFDPSNDPHAEKQRISAELRDRMAALKESDKKKS